MKSTVLVIVASVITQCYSLNISRIVNGFESEGDVDYPYMVAVLYRNIPVCGGTIVSTTYVLTAAHCIARDLLSPGSFAVLSGRRTLSAGQRHAVVRVCASPRYSDDPYRLYPHDVGMILLRNAIRTGPTQSPINLPTVDYAIMCVPSCQIGTVCGWGTKGGIVPRSTLTCMDAAVLNSDICRGAYGGRMADDTFCGAPTETRMATTCNGDAGGGLVVNGAVAGVVSYEVCDPGRFVVFSNVFQNRLFIDQAMLAMGTTCPTVG